MTIICALHEPGVGTWIGSDTQSIGSDGRRWPGAGSKFAIAHGWAVGSAGQNRIGCLMEHHAGELLDGMTGPFEFTRRLVNGVFVLHDIKRGTDNGAPDCGNCFVLAGPGGAWAVDSALGWLPCAPGRLVAMGSGSKAALGAAMVATDIGASGRNIVLLAVEASIAIDVDCGGEPFVHLLPEIVA